MDITTYKELASLTREEVDAYSPEEFEALKTSIEENEAKMAKEKDDALAKTKEDYENQKIRAEKAEKSHKKDIPSEKKENKLDDKLIERLDKMALQVAGIKEADEVELFNKWKEDTGREADDIVGNNIFKKELEDIRTAKANLDATSGIKGEQGGAGGAKDNPDYWIGKATKGKDGKLEFPEETPKHLYSKILDKMAKNEPNSSEHLKFYNE